jgi:hypothetical protein
MIGCSVPIHVLFPPLEDTDLTFVLCGRTSPFIMKKAFFVLVLVCNPEPYLLFVPDSEGFHRDLSLNGEKVSFECRTTSVAVRLTELMALADINNRPQVSPVVTLYVYQFECRTTSVAVRLTELMALADINNRPQVSLLVIRDIFMWIRILGSVPLTNGSGSFLQ